MEENKNVTEPEVQDNDKKVVEPKVQDSDNKEARALKKKEFEAKVQEKTKERDGVLSVADYKLQQKYIKRSKSISGMISLGIILGIIGFVVGIVLYGKNNMSVWIPVATGAGGILLGVGLGAIIDMSLRASVKGKLKPDLVAKYEAISKEIYNFNVEIKEIDALDNRVNKLFVCFNVRGQSYFDEKGNEFFINNVSFGELQDGVTEFELEPGRYYLNGKFGCNWTDSNGKFYTIHKYYQAMYVNVGENGAFVAVDVYISPNGKYSIDFVEVDSKSFNEWAQKLGVKKYY